MTDPLCEFGGFARKGEARDERDAIECVEDVFKRQRFELRASQLSPDI